MPKPTKGPRLGGGPAHERLLLANLENSQDSELVTSLRDNLALYQRGQACRLPWRDDDPVFFPVPKRPELPSQTSMAKQR